MYKIMEDVWPLLISGVLATVISLVVQYRNNLRKDKMEILNRIMGYRYDLKSKEFNSALNSIMIIFNKSNKVMEALEQFWEITINSSSETKRDPVLTNDRLLKLIKAMCDDLGIKHGDFNDTFFMRPFN